MITTFATQVACSLVIGNISPLRLSIAQVLIASAMIVISWKSSTPEQRSDLLKSL